MHDLRLTKTHIANLLLSLVAVDLFFSNQVNVFAGGRLDLHEQTGAYLLAGFLAVGILVQMGKLIEGHQHWLQLLWTITFLVVHIAAEIFIWVRTQISLLGIPDTLPLWIVGLYWVFGIVDVLFLYGPRELHLFKGESEYQRTAREVAELKQQLALAQQARHFAQQSQGKSMPSQYNGICPDCGQEFAADSQRGLQNAMNAHQRWALDRSSARMVGRGRQSW